MYILWIGLIINATITVSISVSCDTDGGWLQYEGKCFKHYDKAVTWEGAQGTCDVLRKALLATVDRPEINTFVHNLTRGRSVWIGLRILDISISTWKWADGGDTLSYFDWKNEVVTSACAVMKKDNSESSWFTRPCTDLKYYICEKEISADNCSGGLSFDNHCYLIIAESKETNMAAAQNCWKYDAYLISINSETEADFIYRNIEDGHEYWIGLSPLNWVNGVPYQWNNWGDIGPTHNVTNGCVYMDATRRKWFCGNCANAFLANGHHSYICERDAVMQLDTTLNVAVKVDTSTNTILGESQTTIFDALNVSTVQISKDNSKQLLLTVIVPIVCGGLVAFFVIIVVVILIRRKRRSNGYNKRNQLPINTTDITNDKAVTGGCNEDKGEHQGQENYIYDVAEVVQADNETVVVNGDVYAIVDKDNIQHPKVQDNMVSQQHTKHRRKKETAKGSNHIIIGADVYAIVNKNSVKPDSQQKSKQKKKKPPTPPKLEDNSGEIDSNGLSHIVVADVYAVVDKERVKPNKQLTTQQKKKKPPTPPKLEDKTEKTEKENINTNGLSHKVVGTDVYAVIDKEKVKSNKQQTPQQKKKKPPAPPKLVDKADVMHEGSLYYEADMITIPATPTKHKPKEKKKTEEIGVVYADLDLTGSAYVDRQGEINDEQSGVVYAEVRG